MFFAAEVHVAVTSQLLLGLSHQSIQAGFDVGQALADVSHEGSVERLGQKTRAASGGDVAVGRVVLEKVHFVVESLLQGLVALDVLLRAVDNANEAQLQGVDTPRKNVERICSVIHQVKLGQDANGSAAQGIDMTGQLQGFRVDNVDICGRDSQDDTVGLGNVFRNQVTGLLLDVAGLVANGNLQQCLEAASRLKVLTAGRHTFVRPGRSTNVKFRTWGE